MPRILHRLPFYDAVSSVEVQGATYRVLPLQLIVWVSLAHQGLSALEPQTPRLPAVLDPAYTDGFLIHEEHLRQFAGLRPGHLTALGASMRSRDRTIPLYAANVWVHANQPGQRDQFSSAAPFLLELHRGIGITTGTDLYPRLPLLGARAFRAAGLHIGIDYRNCQVSVRTRRPFWLFA